jgi:hypothetical protein
MLIYCISDPDWKTSKILRILRTSELAVWVIGFVAPSSLECHNTVPFKYFPAPLVCTYQSFVKELLPLFLKVVY